MSRFSRVKKGKNAKHEPLSKELISLVEASAEVHRNYDACMTTNEYGSTYLDPEKCKAINFDPLK